MRSAAPLGWAIAVTVVCVAAAASWPARQPSGPRSEVPGGEDGASLIVRHRCGACHAGLPPPEPAAPLRASGPLAVYTALRSAPPGGHPDFRLSDAEALSIALGVAGISEAGAAGRELARLRRRLPDATPELGVRFARGLNCGGCHHALPASGAAGPALMRLAAGTQPEWLRAFLTSPVPVRPFGTRPGSGARMPDFGLTPGEADSVAAFLLGAGGTAAPPLDADVGAVPAPVSAHAAGVADALLDLLSCRGCHRYGGRGGRIGPALDEVHRRRTAAYIRGIIADPAATAPGAAMPHITDARTRRVAELLVAGPSPGSSDPSAASADSATARAYLSPLDHPLLDPGATGAAGTYAAWCAACHGVGGDGDGFNARYLSTRPLAHTDGRTLERRADDTVFDGVAAGGAAMGRSPEMPPFVGTLPAGTVRGLVGYIRALCDCAAPAWAGSDSR